MTVGDSGKRGKGKESRTGKKGPEPVVESPRPEGVGGSNPLLQGLEEEQGRLFLPGNTVLVHLALSCETLRHTHSDTRLQLH